MNNDSLQNPKQTSSEASKADEQEDEDDLCWIISHF